MESYSYFAKFVGCFLRENYQRMANERASDLCISFVWFRKACVACRMHTAYCGCYRIYRSFVKPLIVFWVLCFATVLRLVHSEVDSLDDNETFPTAFRPSIEFDPTRRQFRLSGMIVMSLETESSSFITRFNSAAPLLLVLFLCVLLLLLFVCNAYWCIGKVTAMFAHFESKRWRRWRLNTEKETGVLVHWSPSRNVKWHIITKEPAHKRDNGNEQNGERKKNNQYFIFEMRKNWNWNEDTP